MKVPIAALLIFFGSQLLAAPVTTTDELVAAVNEGAEGETIEIAAGTYELSGSLRPKAGMAIKGGGIGKTILTHTPDGKPSFEMLPDSQANMNSINIEAYLVLLVGKSPTSGFPTEQG